jgi:hypothetical protein
MINHAPKPVKMRKQKQKTISCTLLVQKRLDLKTVSETKMFQTRSQDQWMMANIKKPINPKMAAFIAKKAPIVAHHKRK